MPTPFSNYLEEAFRFIACAPIGRKTLKQFLPKYAAGEIKIEELDSLRSIENISRSQLSGKPAACFIFNGTGKIIYVERNRDIGVLGPLLFHEIVHSLDEDYISSYSKQEFKWNLFLKKSHEILLQAADRMKKNASDIKLVDLERNEINEIEILRDESERFNQVRLFISERKAYSELYILTQQLKQIMRGYSQTLQKARENGYIFHRFVSDEEIIQGYRLNRKYI